MNFKFLSWRSLRLCEKINSVYGQALTMEDLLMSVCSHSSVGAGDPEIPPGNPPEMPQPDVPPDVAPQGPPETTPEPPLGVPPGQPVEFPSQQPGEI
jgi:hypothetical protein